MSAKLSKSWPSVARPIVLNAARYYYQQMNEPFPVSDVAMDQAIEWAHRELEVRDREIREEASDRWIDRWESGKLDDEIKRVIEATYSQLRRAERGLRSHARVKACKRCKGTGYIYTTRQEACPACDKLGKVSIGKKTSRQLDAEIGHLLSGRGKLGT